MDKFLYILCAILAAVMCLSYFPDGAVSVLLVLMLSAVAIITLRRLTPDKHFITNLFLLALLTRVTFSFIIHIFDLRAIFGPDAYLYDMVGSRMTDIWHGIPVPDDAVTSRALNINGSGWGMFYLIGGLYYLFGKSFLIGQAFCATFGALTPPLVYICSKQIFNNERVAKVSSLCVALFPSFILWSSQMLKDGLIIFLLVLSMTLVVKLQRKFSYMAVLILIAALFSIFALRFYIFYMIAFAITGSFVIGMGVGNPKTIFRNMVAVIAIAVGLTYIGVIKDASTDFEKYGNLELVQYTRADLASADSGFGSDMDVSTPAGAIAVIPIGFAYLMFAPFPWEVQKLSQLLVLPETFVWWALMPILLIGLKYTITNRLKNAIPILIFTLMLIVSYSIFQGNVGMAYRQRTQIQVFLFIIIGVGWSVIQERKENKEIMQQRNFRELNRRLESRAAETAKL